VEFRKVPRSGDGFSDRLASRFLAICAGVSVSLLGAIFLVLLVRSFPILVSWSSLEVLLPYAGVTILTGALGTFFGFGPALGLSLYLFEYPQSLFARFMMRVLHIAARVPTVVYGFFALTVVTPLLSTILGDYRLLGYNTLSPSLATGLLIIPLMTKAMLESLGRADRNLRLTGMSLGISSFTGLVTLVVPAARWGIGAGVLIGFSRGIGQTMISALAGGSGEFVSLLQPAQSLAGFIVSSSTGVLSPGTPEYSGVFFAGLLLFTLSFGAAAGAKILENKE